MNLFRYENIKSKNNENRKLLIFKQIYDLIYCETSKSDIKIANNI